MSSKLSVIFYIILCLEIGIVLACLPWIPQGVFGLSDWSNNYFLVLAARKTGFYGLQSFVAPDGFAGSVGMVFSHWHAVWEIILSARPCSPGGRLAAQKDRQQIPSTFTPILYLITSGVTSGHDHPAGKISAHLTRGAPP